MRWYRIAVGACLVAGLVLRARGVIFGTIPVWFDEAEWADILFRTSVWAPSIRPLGFMAITKALVMCFGEREVVLRLLPWLAGVGTLLLSVPLARRLLTHRAARLLFIAIVAFQPAAIDFSKEFKPYSVSLFLHLLCLFFALGYVKTRTSPDLARALGSAFLALFFAQDIVFALPSLYLVVGLVALEHRLKAHWVAAVACAAVTLGVLLAFYFVAWRHVSRHKDEAFWGNKYDVFFVQGSAAAHVRWVLEKFGEIAALPGQRSELWSGAGPRSTRAVATVASLYRGLWMILTCSGIARLVQRRRFIELGLLTAPLVVLFGFNALGFWPFGAFRTNLFAIGYASALAACALDGFDALERVELVPALATTVLPLLLFERGWHAEKRWSGGEMAFGDVTHALVRLQGRHRRHHHREPLVLDTYTCRVFNYYMRLHPDYRGLERDFERRFTTQCEPDTSALSAAEHLASNERVWAVISSPRARSLAEQGHIANLLDERTMPHHGGVLLELGPPATL